MLNYIRVSLLLFSLSLSHNSFADEPAIVSGGNDGVYHIEITETVAACAKLCNTDQNNVCRGYSFYQANTQLEQGECSLNNGLGEASDFKVTSPDDINIDHVIADMNAYRAKFDLAPLKWSSHLTIAAEIHAADLSKHGLLQHEGTDGSNHGQRVKSTGYNFRLALENVAAGQQSWESVLQSWKDSPGHNKNLLNADATEIGVALSFNPKTRFASYWAMVLASPLEYAR